MAYLVKYENLSLADAFQQVRTSRCVIAPNKGFWNQLIEYEKSIRGVNSVQMVPLMSNTPDVYLSAEEKSMLEKEIEQRRKD